MTMTSQKCKWCNCELTESQIKGENKYCSVSCYRAMQRSGAYSGVKEPAHKNRCFTCGAETNKRPSQKRNGELADKVFCCRECYLKHHSATLEERTCEICGDVFVVPSSSRKKICKTSCRQKHRISECKVCGVKFSAISPRRGGGYSRVTRVLCSSACRSEFMRTDQDRKEKISLAFTGEKHPMWRGGVRSKAQSRGRFWASIREAVFIEKGNSCELCGINREQSKEKYGCDLHIDHITPWHEFEDESMANRIDNLRPLCVSCHGKIGEKCQHGMYSEKSGHSKDLEYMLRVYGKKCNLTIDSARYIVSEYKGNWIGWSNIAEIEEKTGISRHIIRSIAKGEHWINAYL